MTWYPPDTMPEVSTADAAFIAYWRNAALAILDVLRAVRGWHEEHRPLRWSDAEWAANPTVNCATPGDCELATAFARLEVPDDFGVPT